jgi:hypothetical protein
MTFAINERVRVLHELCKDTPGYGTVIRVKKVDNETVYDVCLEWAISNIGTLTNLKANTLAKL